MKTALKIFGGLLVVLLLVIIILPFALKGKIRGVVQEQIDQNVNAKVAFGDFDLSVLSTFPNLGISLEELSVVGLGRFEKDTLFQIQQFALQVDLMKAINGKYELESILLKHPRINLIVTADSAANWDIAKPSDEVTPEDTTASGPLGIEVALKRFAIENADFSYRDSTMKAYAFIENLNYTLTGNFSEKVTTLVNKADVEKTTVFFEGIRYLKAAHIAADAEVEADLENSKFTFKDNLFQLNEIKLNFAGVVSMPDTVNMDLDLKMGAKELNFKELLSLVPAIYTKDFAQLTARGELGLTGEVKGRFGPASYPAALIHLWVKNGMFKYADLPKSVDNIQVDMKVATKAGKDIDAEVNLDKGHIELAANPFDARFYVHYYPTDMDIDGALKGRIDLSSLADAIPMEDMAIKGIVTADVSMKGKYSDVEKENYEQFATGGNVELKDFQFKNSMLPQGMDISAARMDITSQRIDLSQFQATTGKSDFALRGFVSNYIQFVFKDQTVAGNLAVTSKLLDVNELLANLPTDTTQVSTTEEATGAVEVPEKIDFVLNTNIGTMKFDSLDITNIKGMVEVRNQRLSLSNLAMELLDGKMIATGAYDTKTPKRPTADFVLDIQQFEIAKAVKSFSSIPKMAPIARETSGKISGKVNIFAVLDTAMSPVLNTVDSKGSLSSGNINVRSKLLAGTGKLIKRNDWDNVDLKDFKLDYTIEKGILTVKPIVLDIKGQKLNFSGTQSLEKNMDYLVSTDVNSQDVGLGNLGLVPIDVRIGGTISEPKYTLDTQRAQEKAKEAVVTKGKEAAEKLIDQVKEDPKKAVDEGKKIIKNLFNKGGN